MHVAETVASALCECRSKTGFCFAVRDAAIANISNNRARRLIFFQAEAPPERCRKLYKSFD